MSLSIMGYKIGGLGDQCYDQLFIMRQDIRYKYILVSYKYILIRLADRSRIRISQV